MQTTRARSTRLSEALAYLGTSTSCTEVRHENVAAPSTLESVIRKAKAAGAVTMAVHAVKMAAVCRRGPALRAIYLHRVALMNARLPIPRTGVVHGMSNAAYHAHEALSKSQLASS